MKIKYVWLSQNGTQSARYSNNNSKVMMGTSNKKNVREINQHSRSLKKMKRFRSAFTTYQINYLETEFRKFPYVGLIQRKEIAAALKIPERAVKVWFQNRRMKEKKESVLKEPDNGTTGRKILESTEKELHFTDSGQSIIGTQLDSILFITNNVDGSKYISSNNEKLKREGSIKVNNMIDRTCENLSDKCIYVSTFFHNNQSSKFSLNSGKYNNKNVKEHDVKQSQAQLKKQRSSSINRFLENKSPGILEDVSIKNQRVSPQKHQADNSEKQENLSKKTKRFRSAFTTEQTSCLEREFKKLQYIGNAQRKEIADSINIPESAVKIWFQNRRMKEKKEPCIKEYEENPSRNMSEFPKDRETILNDVPLTNKHASRSIPVMETYVNNVINSNEICKIKNQEINIVNVKETGPTNPEKNVYKNQTNGSLLVGNGNPQLNYNTFSINLSKDKQKNGVKEQGLSSINELHREYHQDKPEDLSLKKQKTSQMQSAEAELTDLMSNFCSNTYVQHGGILWKPINIVPVVSVGTSLPLTVNNSNNVSLAEAQYLEKVKCSCDCHVKMVPVPMVLRQSLANPQYVINTLPVSSNSQNPSLNVNN